MRIVLVSHGFPPKAAGGAELYAHAHASELARTGDDVFVIARESDAGRPEYAVRREEQNGFAVAWINNTFAAVSSFEDSYRNAQIGEIAAGLIDAFSPEVAHIHHLTCLSTRIVDTLKSRGTPIFYTLHDYWLLCHRGQLLDVNLKICNGPETDGCGACLGPAATMPASAYAARSALARMGGALPSVVLPPLRRVAATLGAAAGSAGRAARERGVAASRGRLTEMRAVMDGVTHFFAPSRCMRDRFVAFGIDPDRISVSEYGLEPRARVTKPRVFGSRPLRVGFLGSLMVSKAPHLLIEACASLPPGSVSVDLWGEPADYHGDDRYRAQLRGWLDRQPGVRAHGPIAHDAVASALAQVDVLAVTSIWPENSPFVIREAFLAGVPVVAARIGGIPETVEHDVNGLLFEPGNAQDLRRILQRFLNEPDLWPRLQRGIPPVRTLAEDVAAMRARYVQVRTRRVRRSRLAAVVLNFRTPGDTFLAARSLLHSDRSPDEVVVVDNDSSPGGAEAFQSIRSRVTYVRTGVNLGFSGGMNAGIREALARGAERVLLLNSDVIVAPDCIGRLELALDASSRLGIAGPVVLARRAPDRVLSAGMDYDVRTGRMRHRGVGTSAADGTHALSAEVAAVSGSAMLVTREVFERIGLLEPDYFFSFEDLDFCLRARAAGLASTIVGGAVAFHEGSQSIGPRSTRRLYFGARNHLLLSRRNSPGRSVAARAGRTIFIVGLNLAHAAARASGGTLVSRVGAVLRGSRDYMAGRFGEDSAGRVDPAAGS